MEVERRGPEMVGRAGMFDLEEWRTFSAETRSADESSSVTQPLITRTSRCFSDLYAFAIVVVFVCFVFCGCFCVF